ncbi:hypothetical protein NE237_022298 [Protea cynaroides]|uniref:Flavin-containing monooxygenase n=1 Tax=Protea cynaroides TaxID=273540 RepID=A0A9Q0K3D8_9MAGN|nr:hypothetical protein NE237_022298 [Protea cynaroides]
MVSAPILNPINVTNSPPPHVPFSYPIPTPPSDLLTKIVRDPKFVHPQSQSIPPAEEPSLNGKFFPLQFSRVCISVVAKTTAISSPTNETRAQDKVKSHRKETDSFLFFIDDNTDEDMFSGCASAQRGDFFVTTSVRLHGRTPPLPTTHRLLSFPVLVYSNNTKFTTPTQNPFSCEILSHHSLDSAFARPSSSPLSQQSPFVSLALSSYGCGVFGASMFGYPAVMDIVIGNGKGFQSLFYQQLQEIVSNLQRLRLQEDNTRQTAAFILARAAEHGQLLETGNPNTSSLFNQSSHYWKYSSLEDLRGLMVAVAKNQQVFRLLQNKFKEGRVEERDIIFAKVKDHANLLMVHPFGNYLVQRIFEACTEEQKMGILCTITKKELQLIPICLDMHGTCAIEKLFEHHITPEPISCVMLVLRQGTVIPSDLYFKAALVDKYAKCGETDDGRKVFDTMLNRDLICWTAIITAYEQSECPEESLILFQEMQEEGHTPDSCTVVGVASAVSFEMQHTRLLWVKEGLKESWTMAFRWIKLSNWLSYRATGNDTQSLCTTVCKWIVRSRKGAEADRDDPLIELDELYDGVVVCNGYFSEPFIAEILGIDSRLGRQIHNHNFRVLDSFCDEAVILIGSSSSGADVSRDIARTVKEARIIGRSIPNATIAKQPDSENIWLRSTIKKVHGDGTLVFQDGSSVDIVLHCIGYKYHFPLMETHDIVTMNDKHVGPLYKHDFPPSLAPWFSFYWFTMEGYSFPNVEFQGKWVAGVWCGWKCHRQRK